jgi:hypothetical protein
MSAAAERSLRVRMRVRNSSSRASVDAMGARNGRNAAVLVRNRNVRRNSSAFRSSRPPVRKPRASGRPDVGGVVAVEIVAKSLRFRTLPLRNSSSNRVRRANRVLLARRRPRVRMPRV